MQQYASKRFVRAVVASTLVILTISAYLDLRSSRNLREIAKAQFNEEQRVIARHLSWQIERELAFIRTELLMVSSMLSGWCSGGIAGCRPQLEAPLGRLLEKGVLCIDFIDRAAGQVHTFGFPRTWRVSPLTSHYDDDPAANAVGDYGVIVVASPRTETGHVRMTLSHRPADGSPGLLIELDVTRFLESFVKNLRSGKTGYAWIIDANGTFLYHPYADFIGRSAFAARQQRDPDISQQTINFIQKNKMLAGKEGTGAYTTGWHRGITGSIEKLIAYTPIVVSDAPQQLWSVAVVAPLSEIEDYINQTYVWRFLYQAVILVVIVVAATVVLFNERRWRRELEGKVTERTEALQKSEEKYRSLVESAEDFIFTLDRQGCFQSMNSFTAHFFGGRPENFIGRQIEQILPRETSQTHRFLLESVFTHERSIRDEFALRAGDHEIWLSTNFMPIRDEAGHVESVLCIARDVTNEKNLERQLINTEKLASLGTLAAGVAHEINNPLGVILGFSDYLIRKTPKQSQTYEDLKTIERQGVHCKQIVENLLRFARFGEEAQHYSKVNEGLREIIGIVGHTLEMSQIELTMCLADDMPEVRGDPRELQQVYLNLINNACAAMKGGGRLTIRSAFDHKNNKVMIAFEDTGHGIQPRDLDRIFEPFFTTKPEGEGTGLGLSVTYGIVTKYGGSIDCRSTPVDARDSDGRHGTHFVIRLPIYEAQN